MRKFIGLAIVVALLAFVSPSYGAVAVHDEVAEQASYVGEATSIKIEGQDVTFDGSQVTILANGHKDGVTTMVSPAVDANTSGISSAELAFGVIVLADTGPLDSSDERYIPIADGTPGQMVTIMLTAATAGTIFISDDGIIDANMTTTGWDDIALATALDSVTLLWLDDTYGWIVVGEYGATIT